MKGNKRLLLIILGLAIFLTSVHTVAAQTPSGIDVTVSPAIIELENIPGSRIPVRFRIRNNQTVPIRLGFTVDKLSGSDPRGHVVPEKAKAGDTSTQWISFSEQSITALPKEWSNVEFTITVPKEAAFGYYYAIRIAQLPQDIQQKTNATVMGEVLLPVLLEVRKEGAVKSASLIEFRSASVISEYLPVTFMTTIANNGNVHIKPQGNIFIRSGSGKDIGILEINPGLGSILPGGRRVFESSWNDGFITYGPVLEDGAPKLDGSGKQVQGLTINWNKLTHLRIGRYTAALLAVYDNGKRDVVIESSTTFWVFPYRIVAGAVIALLVLFFLIRFVIGLYVKREIKKYQNRSKI